VGAFQGAAVTNITLPEKLEVLEEPTFRECASLEKVIYNDSLIIMGNHAFSNCPRLLPSRLPCSSITFSRTPFAVCDRLIEFAAADGFPSDRFGTTYGGAVINLGIGVVSYLLNRYRGNEKKRLILLAHKRFGKTLDAQFGTEQEKFDAVKIFYPRAHASHKKQRSWRASPVAVTGRSY